MSCHKILTIAFILSFVFIFSAKSNAASQRMYEYNVPSRLKIVFPPSAKKRYLNLLRKTTLENSPIIGDQYKTKVKIQGSYREPESGVEKFFSGKARITGDLKDHLEAQEGFSSLSLTLKKGNLGGMIKFRLLIPGTKGGNEEILWSLLMEEAGFPSLYRQYVLVTIFGKLRLFLLEERSEKEFLESNGFREGPIIEYDERQIWYDRYVFELPEKLLFDTIAEGAAFYPINTPTFQNIPHVRIDQMRLKNSDFIKNPTSEKIAYRALYPNFERNNDAFALFEEINELYTPHGLGFHNRKYLYDAIYNDYLPIYFDGNPRIPHNICEKSSKLEISEEIKSRVEIIKAKFRERTIRTVKWNDNFSCYAEVILHSVAHKNTNLKNIKPLKNLKWDIATLKKTDILSTKNIYDRPPVYNFDYKKRALDRCEFSKKHQDWTKCEPVKIKKIKKVLAGKDKPKKRGRFKLFPLLNIQYSPETEEKFETHSLLNQDLSIIVDDKTTAYLKVNADHSVVNIKLETQDSAVVFYDSVFTNSYVNVSSKTLEHNINSVRYNDRLLTACATFIDSQLKDTLITADLCSKEDGINFIRMRGTGVDLNIKNVLYDGFDADFSKIKFGTVNVSGAGNDCVDVSSGVYNFRDLNLNNCGDKGISAGERSLVAIQNAEISDTKTGIASKDLSKIYLSRVSIKSTENCMTAYQKKQEYGPGSLYLPSILQNCEFESKNDTGYIKYGETCERVETNYFFDTCLQGKNISVTVKKKIPEIFAFSLKKDSSNKIIDKVDKAYRKKCVESKWNYGLSGNCKVSVKLKTHPKSSVFGLINSKNSIYEYSYAL
jgi:hypothetical protein